MTPVLAFDVYGTLLDTAGVTSALESLVGDRAAEFANLWRDKQLEYSFRRALMQRYEDFSVCVRDALDYSAARFRLSLTNEERETLLGAYRRLPPFPEAAVSLQALGSFSIYAFSNGSRDTVRALLEAAGLLEHFVDVVSVEAVRSFKPSRSVYEYFMERFCSSSEGAWLISGNPFDVIGAMSAGMRGVWIKRSDDAIFDPWEIEPTITVPSLCEIGAAINAAVPRS